MKKKSYSFGRQVEALEEYRKERAKWIEEKFELMKEYFRKNRKIERTILSQLIDSDSYSFVKIIVQKLERENIIRPNVTRTKPMIHTRTVEFERKEGLIND